MSQQPFEQDDGFDSELRNLSRREFTASAAAFVVGMLLTPPDVISQTLLALPVWLLFEIGLIMCRFIDKGEGEEAAEHALAKPDGD